jgi:DegV family protein with EDD domain
MIGVCTDSGSQLPPALVERFGIEVVPLTVTVDGESFLDGVDLDADGLYARYAGGRVPSVSTAAPGPGRFAEAYQRLAEAGATEIVSVHITAAISSTLDSARLATQVSPVPVHLVDSGTASFAVGCCVWEAAEALAEGATAEESAAVAAAVGATTVNAFIVGAMDIVRAGGRLAPGARPPHGDGCTGGGDPTGTIPVLSVVDGAIRPIGTARTVDEAADAMVAVVLAAGDGLRVGLSIADALAAPMWEALERRFRASPQVLDLVRYRVGPSMGAHTGPGTAGAVAYPSRRLTRRR